MLLIQGKLGVLGLRIRQLKHETSLRFRQGVDKDGFGWLVVVLVEVVV